MDQLRFDTLFSQAANAFSRNPGANANGGDSGDAFAQILDQQLAKRDAGPQTGWSARTATPDRPTSRPDDASRSEIANGSATQSDPPRQRIAKRRDDVVTSATTQTAPSGGRPATQQNTVAHAADDSPEQSDRATAAPAAGTDSGGQKVATKAEDQSTTGGDSEEDTEDDGSQNPSQAKDNVLELSGGDLTALLALLTPTQQQAVASATASGTGDLLLSGKGNAAQAALQAALLQAGQPITAPGTAQQSGGQSTAGLTFGAVIADVAKTQSSANGTGVTTTTEDNTEDPSAPNPIAEVQTKAESPADAGRSNTSNAKPRNAAAQNVVANTAPGQSVTPATAAAIQPVKNGAAAAWAGPNYNSDLPEELSVTAGTTTGATSDGEFSTWSEYLGSGAAANLSNGAAARQAAFLAELRQSIQLPPAHEQIAVQIQSAMQNGTNRLTVDLQPAELGRVEIKLDVDKDKNVTATVVVDRPGTLDLLQRDSKALERALQDAGLQTNSGSLSFSLRDSGGQGGNAQNGAAGQGTGQGAAGNGPQEAASQPSRADVVATADGFVDLET